MLIPRNDTKQPTASLRGLCPKQSIIKQIENFTTASLRECVAFVAIYNLAYIKLYKTLQFQTFKIPL
ncbi:hypothetical protein [Helicobacter rodentium]|uniref:hypothetical protein n=1 Tax=Helicobacter rodentium TaxID=59617 RepID=UPI002557E618|nr:hypothetical protein [Helicobacter rodentium]